MHFIKSFVAFADISNWIASRAKRVADIDAQADPRIERLDCFPNVIPGRIQDSVGP